MTKLEAMRAECEAKGFVVHDGMIDKDVCGCNKDRACPDQCPSLDYWGDRKLGCHYSSALENAGYTEEDFRAEMGTD